MAPRSLPLVLVACSLAVTACRKAEITSYRVPKETAIAAATPAASATPPAPAAVTPPPASASAAPSAQASMAQTAVPTAQGAALTWTAPAHWKAKDPGAMRKGSYTVTGEGDATADMSVTSFPGDVGGDLANLNRWRGQVKLPPIAQADFEANTQHLDRNDLHMTVADLLGTGMSGKPERILGAIVPHNGNTWFFKMQGPDALVAKEKAAFMALLDTVKPAPAAR